MIFTVTMSQYLKNILHSQTILHFIAVNIIENNHLNYDQFQFIINKLTHLMSYKYYYVNYLL